MQSITKTVSNKRLVRTKKGAEMYNVSKKTFLKIAKEGGAVIQIGQISWVDLDTFDKYIETFRLEALDRVY